MQINHHNTSSSAKSANAGGVLSASRGSASGGSTSFGRRSGTNSGSGAEIGGRCRSKRQPSTSCTGPNRAAEFKALSEMCARTLAIQAEGQRQLTASLCSTHEAVSRLAEDIHPPTQAVEPAVQHQLDVLTELCSRNIAVQSEGQRALIKNLGQTQLMHRQFSATDFWAVPSICFSFGR